MSSVTYPIDVETPILVCDGLRTNTVDCNQLNFNRLSRVQRTVTLQGIDFNFNLVGPTQQSSPIFYLNGNLVHIYFPTKHTLAQSSAYRAIGFSLPADLIPTPGTFTCASTVLSSNAGGDGYGLVPSFYQVSDYGGSIGFRVDLGAFPIGGNTLTLTIPQGTLVTYAIRQI
jgi:hypothetical protein